MSAYLPHIKILGATQVEGMLLAGERRARNMKPALRIIRDDIRRVIAATFSAQGRRYGGSWEFLKEATIRKKVRRGWDLRILYARHRLVNSLTKSQSNYAIVKMTNDTIELGTKVPYADAHQYGRPEKNIPARPFIDFDRRDEQRWADICARNLVDAMGFTE